MHGTPEPVDIADIAEEPAQSEVVTEGSAHLILLEFIAREDHDPASVEIVESMTDKSATE